MTSSTWGLGRKTSLIVVCFLFGIAVVSQLRTENRIRSTVVDSPTDFAAIAGDLYDNNSVLRLEIDKLLTERSSASSASGVSGESASATELQRLKAHNGVVEVVGPGIEISLDAAISPTDLLDLINELRNAGAEAIAIDGQRVVYNTYVSGAAETLRMSDVPVTSPIIVEATGPPDVLDRALLRKGGMISFLRTSYPRSTVTLVEKTRLNLPAKTISLRIGPTA